MRLHAETLHAPHRDGRIRAVGEGETGLRGACAPRSGPQPRDGCAWVGNVAQIPAPPIDGSR